MGIKTLPTILRTQFKRVGHSCFPSFHCTLSRCNNNNFPRLLKMTEFPFTAASQCFPFFYFIFFLAFSSKLCTSAARVRHLYAYRCDYLCPFKLHLMFQLESVIVLIWRLFVCEFVLICLQPCRVMEVE